MEEVGVGNPPDFAGQPLKTRRKTPIKTRGPHLASRYTDLNVLKDFCCVVLFFWLFFCWCLFRYVFGGKRSNLFCFFAGVYFFWSNQKHPPKQKWWSHESCKKDHVSNTDVLFFFPWPLPNFLLLSSKLTWQQNVDLLKMYLLLKTGFQCHVSSLEGKATFTTPES